MADPRRLVALAAVAAVVLAPVAMPAKALTLAVVLVQTTGAMSLNTLVGHAGQMSLGQGAFVGVGAFVAANLASHHYPLVLTVLAAAVAGGAVATIVGLPSLRIRGLQVAVTTLAFGVMAQEFLFGQQWFSGGAAGILIRRPAPFHSDRAIYYLALAILGFAYWVDIRVRATKAGRAFAAVRDNQERAPSFGVPVGPTKLLAYTVSGVVAGLAGSMFTYAVGAVTPSSFGIFLSLNLVVIVIVGGVGSRVGVLVSSAFILALPALAPKKLAGLNVDAGRHAPLIAAILLVLVVVALPGGFGGLLRQLGDRLFGRARNTKEPLEEMAGASLGVRTGTDPRILREVPRPISLRMPSRMLLEARDIAVRFGGVVALDGVNLEIHQGEIVGLIGANGAGKTTMFNVIAGFVPATGSVRLNGQEILGVPEADRPRSGVARTWQQMGLLRHETVAMNMLLAEHWLARYPAGLGVLGLGGAPRIESELRVRAEVALDILELAHLADHRVGDLPYGVMRRVEIAAAVATGPDLLMLDEASAGLSPVEARDLGDHFFELRDELGLTLFVIEHHVPLIARVSDYVYVLESGHLIAEGTADEVARDPAVLASFLGRSGGMRRPAAGPRRPVSGRAR